MDFDDWAVANWAGIAIKVATIRKMRTITRNAISPKVLRIVPHRVNDLITKLFDTTRR